MPRPRFQIHLTTGLILMFAAGALLYLNLRDAYDPGWPLLLLPEEPSFQIVILGEPHPSWAPGRNPFTTAFQEPNFFRRIQPHALVANTLIALAILSAVALLSEFLLTRRTAPREPTP